MFSESFNFRVIYLQKKYKIVCKFITYNNDIIILQGDTIEEIFEQCVLQFPQGVKTKGIVFEGKNSIESKVYFCNLISLGLKTGYFKESDFLIQELEDDLF